MINNMKDGPSSTLGRLGLLQQQCAGAQEMWLGPQCFTVVEKTDCVSPPPNPIAKQQHFC